MSTDDQRDSNQLTGTDGEPLPYHEAIAELEAILSRLEASTVDVDQLADQVGRATRLIAHCRDRLDQVRTSVTSVLDEAASGGEGST